MPAMKPEELYRRLTEIIQTAPSLLENGALPPEVMKWVGDASALIEATGDLTFSAESQVAMNGLHHSNRMVSFQKLLMILYKARALTERDFPAGARRDVATVAAAGSAAGLGAASATGAQTAASIGTAGLSANPVIGGAEAQGLAGNVSLSIQNDTPTGGVIIAEGETERYQGEGTVEFAAGGEDRPEVLHETLMARVAVLEVAVQELRTPSGVGIGHNRPPPDEPAFVPITSDDLDEIERLITLLREQPPIPRAVPSQIIAQSRVVTKIGAKIGELADNFAIEAAKSAGQEFGKRLVQVPFWLGILGAIQGVTSALQQWIAVLPH
jgi:hypothetical protein